MKSSHIGPVFCALQEAFFLFLVRSVVNITSSFDNIAYFAALARLFPKIVNSILVWTRLGTLIMLKNARLGEDAKLLKNFFFNLEEKPSFYEHLTEICKIELFQV